MTVINKLLNVLDQQPLVQREHNHRKATINHQLNGQGVVGVRHTTKHQTLGSKSINLSIFKAPKEI